MAMKRGSVINISEIEAVFSDQHIGEIARTLKIPENAVGRFGEDIRWAVRNYISEVTQPSPNEQNKEIQKLCKAALWEDFSAVALALEGLSAISKEALISRGRREAVCISLPEVDDLRNPLTQTEASIRIRRLCSFGCEYREGRKRPTGRSSKSWKPFLYAPKIKARPKTREAERTLAMWFCVAYTECTGKCPPKSYYYYEPGPVGRALALIFQKAHIPASPIDTLNQLMKQAGRLGQKD